MEFPDHVLPGKTGEPGIAVHLPELNGHGFRAPHFLYQRFKGVIPGRIQRALQLTGIGFVGFQNLQHGIQMRFALSAQAFRGHAFASRVRGIAQKQHLMRAQVQARGCADSGAFHVIERRHGILPHRVKLLGTQDPGAGEQVRLGEPGTEDHVGVIPEPAGQVLQRVDPVQALKRRALRVQGSAAAETDQNILRGTA